LLAGIVVYLALLPVWWVSLDGLSFIAGVSANVIYQFFDPQVTMRPEGKTVSVVVTAAEESGFGGETQTSGLKMDTVTYGLPLLLALVIATRSDSWRRKARAAAVALGLAVLLTVPAVLLWAKLTSLQLDDRIAQASGAVSGDRSSFLYYAFHGYAFSQPVVAVAVWIAMLTLGMFRDKPRVERPAAAPMRNAPCPCGSGRKYKRCCGAR